MKPKNTLRSFAIAVGALLAVSSAQAATFIWTNLANSTPVANGNWSGGESWSGVPISAADTTLSFGYTYGINTNAETNTLTNDVANPFLLNVLTLGGATPTAGSGSSIALINIAGSPLNFVLNGAITPQVNLSQNRSNGQVVSFNVQSNVQLTNNTLFTGNGTANFTVSGGISGAGNLSKGGTSRLVLSGTNSYAGTTTISGGMLQLTNAASLYNNTSASWTAANIGVASGATLALNVGGTGEFTTANVTTILNNLGGANGSSSGGFAAGSAIGLVNAGAVTIANTITDTTGTGGGALGITKFGAGTLTLTGANTYTGTTSILQGNLTLAPTAGGMTLGAITATTGATPALGIAAANKTLTLGGAGTNSISSIIETTGAGQQLIILKNTAATWTLGNVNVRSGNTSTVSSGILNLNGTFEWTDGNFDRRFIVSGGQLNYNNAGALKTLNGRLQMTGGSMDNTSGAAITTSTHNPNLELAGNWTFIGSNGADSDLNFGTGAVRIVGTSGTNRTITVQNAATKLTLGGAISSNAAWNSGAAPGAAATNGLIKAGDGTLVLTGSNSYTGNTAINGGTLVIGSTASLPGWNVNGRYSVANNATLAVRNAVTDGQIASMLGTTNFQAGSRLGFDTGSGDRTYSVNTANTAQGALGLTKLGANTLNLTGANIYTGGTLVTGGTLLVNNLSGSGTGTGDVTVEAGGTLGGNGTIGGAVFLASGATFAPGNSIGSTTTGAETWSGDTFFEFEFSTDGSTGAAGSQWDQLNINGTLDLTNANSVTMQLVSMLDMINPGPLAQPTVWDPLQNAIWAGFITTTGGFIDFDANLFSFNFDGFPNDIDGVFSVAQNGNNLNLVYTANFVIPEPSRAILFALGLVALLGRRRR